MSIKLQELSGMYMKPSDVTKYKRALIVDDDQVIRLTLRALMRDAEFEVVGEASNGIKAMELIEKHRPTVVLLDIVMPGESGLDIMLEIAEKFPLVRTVIISGDATSEHVKTALERGASGFIAKPFNFNNVIKNVDRAVAEGIILARSVNQKEVENNPGLLEETRTKEALNPPRVGPQ